MKPRRALRLAGGVLRRVGASLTRNWGLKLVALALALLVYFSLKQETLHKYHDTTLFQQPAP